MPIHDWTRADDLHHSFLLGWVCDLSRRLTNGGLPPHHYALIETLELRPPAGFVELPEPEGPYKPRRCDDGPARYVDEHPPAAHFRVTDDRRQYACKAVTVRGEFHQPVAAVLFPTRQDKETPYRLDALVRLAVGALTRGIHLLVVDLFPPSLADPHGIHKAIWDRVRDEPFPLTPGKPLSVAAYDAGGGDGPTAYVEPLAVGDPLPDAPLFLRPGVYVPCPLEASYMQAWDVFPAAVKGEVNPSGAAAN